MRKGFTLLELLIVVIIIAILATFAIPMYLNAVEKAKIAKAKHHLALIAQAEKLCHTDSNTFVTVSDDPNSDSCTTSNNLGDYVEMGAIANDDDWDYQSTAATNTTFTLQATRNISTGAVAGCTISLTQDGAWTDNCTSLL